MQVIYKGFIDKGEVKSSKGLTIGKIYEPCGIPVGHIGLTGTIGVTGTFKGKTVLHTIPGPQEGLYYLVKLDKGYTDWVAKSEFKTLEEHRDTLIEELCK